MADGMTSAPIAVHFVLLDDGVLLDWAGPAEALRAANDALTRQGRSPAFTLHVVGPQARCRTSVGAYVSGIDALPPLADATGGCHWVVLIGQTGARVELGSPQARATLAWLASLPLMPGRLELVCVCAGAVLAARAGQLAHRQATTHHRHLDELRAAEPRCEVLVNRVFVADGPVWTSAGVTTGIDLMLHRIAGVCGPALAADVAQNLVLALRRGPNDPELSPFLRHRQHLHAALHRVQDAVSQQPQRDWSVARMAEVACTSPRHLTRLFVEHAGIAPLQYLRRLRLDLADAALQSGHNVTQAAALAGFGSDTQLRRAWHLLGKAGSPSRPGR